MITGRGLAASDAFGLRWLMRAIHSATAYFTGSRIRRKGFRKPPDAELTLTRVWWQNDASRSKNNGLLGSVSGDNVTERDTYSGIHTCSGLNRSRAALIRRTECTA